MASVQVSIAGRSYRMACADGEEGHLQGLAASFDAKISDFRSAFGEIGDMRLHVMAALMTADELSETRRRVEALESEIVAMRAVSSANAERLERAERHVADAINQTAERLEHLARAFGPGGAPVGEPGKGPGRGPGA